MPAFLYSRQGISSPANAEGIPEHFLCAYKRGWPAGYPAKDSCRLIGRHPCTASMRRSHVQHDTARVPRRTPFWPKPQKGAKTLFPVHPAALINEPPAPHRERQVAAKGGMLQTRSRPQSCGFRPPVLAAIAKRRCAPGVGQPTCGAPDAAEPVEQKPLPPYAAGVRKSAFFR